MKTKMKYVLILMVLFFAGSCTDFLDEINKTGKTEDIVYSTEASVNNLVAACYSYNRLWYGKEAGFGLSEGGTDLWYNGKDNSQVDLVTYKGITPELSSGVFDQYWEAFYTAINLCNLAEKNIDKITTFSAEKKAQLKSEVYFLRAFYYWHLVETWGAVQINLEPIATPLTTATRNSVDEVYTQMFKDVQYAIDNLPASQAPNSHATHWAAKALKARLALYYASEYGHSEYYAIAASTADDVIANCPGKALDDSFEDIWDIKKSTTSKNPEFIWAVDYYDILDDAIPYNNLPPRMSGDWNGLIVRRAANASGGYGGSVLHLMVTPLWQSQSDAVGGSTIAADVLQRIAGPYPNSFYTVASPSTKVTVDVGYWYVVYGLGYTRYAPTRYCLNLFDEKMDQRFNATFRTAWYKFPTVVPKDYGKPTCKYPDMSVGTQTDTCLYYSKNPLTAAQKAWASTRYKVLDVTNTFEADGITPNSSTANSGANTMYPMMRKFENTDSKITVPVSSFNDYFSYRDVPIFRISEMYLIAAEAYMSSNQSKAVTLANTLRGKRALPGKAEAMKVTSVDLKFILEERAREFAGENIRWFDLKRTKKLKEQLVNNTKSKDFFDETKHYLRPIPAIQFQATTNKGSAGEAGKFWQNPGY
jgi:starch-binding outer membrane protein, SusD/RagB family